MSNPPRKRKPDYEDLPSKRLRSDDNESNGISNHSSENNNRSSNNNHSSENNNHSSENNNHSSENNNHSSENNNHSSENNNHSSENNNHSSENNSHSFNNNRSSNNNHSSSNGTNGTPSNGTNGDRSNGTNGHPSNGTNGHPSNGTNGHPSNGTNGHPSNGTNGHPSNGTNENGYVSTDADYGNGHEQDSLQKKRKPERDEDFPYKRVKYTMDIDENNKSSSSEEVKSNYDGVYWLERESKWVAQLTYRKHAHTIGKFDSELEAAIAVNLKCQELNIPPRNPGVNEMTAKQNKVDKKSDYVGVSWDKREQKWLARFTHKGKPHFVGYFDDEVEAAIAINGRCRYLDIPIKNENVESTYSNQIDTPKQVARPFSGKSSKYNSVYWEQESKMWHARLTYNGKSISLGQFYLEIDAAIAANKKCQELGIPLENPNLKGYKLAPRHGEKKTSQYKHVNWDRSSKKWRAQMSINGKQTYIGLFETERAAAIAVNEKCQLLGIPLRNQILELDPETYPPQNFFRHSSDDRKDAENGKVPENGYAKFNCVFWDHQNHVWYGLIRYGEKDIHCGYFATEVEAAIAVNEKCREIGIALKNPTLEISINQQSQYECVFWDDDVQAWTAKFEYKGMMQNLGHFTSEFEAAKAVNQKCAQYGIPLKNLYVGIDSNNNYSSDNNNHSKMSISNGSNGNNNHGSNHSHPLSNGTTNGHPSNGTTNGHPSNGTNGHPSNGTTNGHPSNGATNGHPSNGTSNGDKSNGTTNGHKSNGTGSNGNKSNGHSSNGRNGQSSENGWSGNNQHLSNGNGQSNHFSSNGTNGGSVVSNERVNGRSVLTTDDEQYLYNGDTNGEMQFRQLPDDFDQEAWNALIRELEAKNRQIHEHELQLKDKNLIIATQKSELEELNRKIEEQQIELSKQQSLIDSLNNRQK